MTFLVVLLGAAACTDAEATEEGVDAALAAITPEVPRSHVRFLSHDLLRGRGSGDVGFEVAREYVVAQFERIGLEPGLGSSFVQPFQVRVVEGDGGSELHVGGSVLTAPDVGFDLGGDGETSWEGEAVHLGYGLFSHGRDDYAGEDVAGKAVILLAGTPPDWPVDRDARRTAWAKTEMALRRGAALVVQISDPEASPPEPDPDPARGAGPFLPTDGTVTSIRPAAVVGPAGSRALAETWGIEDPTRPVGSVGRIRLVRRPETRIVTSWNVIGVIRGSDERLRDEAVVISAHLDHVGMCAPDATGDDLCNGTHDNALGIAKMLTLAEAMVRTRPRRSVVFLAAGAEEGGLVGSWHYVRNPVIPMEQTLANINMDGGRTGAKTDDIIANAVDFSEMAGVVEAVMGELGVGLTEGTSAAELIGLSSDHRSFLMAGVPSLDLKPGYSVAGDVEVGRRERMHYMDTWRHRPADGFDESFTFESAAEMARRTFHLTRHLADMEGTLRMNPDQAMARERGSPEAPYYFGPGYPIGASISRDR